jgi:hypothetical protein
MKFTPRVDQFVRLSHFPLEMLVADALQILMKVVELIPHRIDFGRIAREWREYEQSFLLHRLIRARKLPSLAKSGLLLRTSRGTSRICEIELWRNGTQNILASRG